MIDLFSIKMNGEYDEIGALPTIQNGTFLCSDTLDCDCNCNFQKGYSYQITNGVASRIEQNIDFKLQNNLYATIQNVCEWLNNWFTIRYDYTDFYGHTGRWHEVAQFPSSGDLCKIRTTNNWDYISQYSFFFLSYVTVDGETVSSDNPRFNPNEAYFYYIMHLPQDVELAISQMMYYDGFTRGKVTGLRSENIGNYSYSLEEVTVGALAYPKSLVAGIENNYKKVRFVQ